MEHESALDAILDAIGAAGSDLVEHVLDVIHEGVIDIGSLNHDDIVKLVAAGVSGSAGAAVRFQLQRQAEAGLARGRPVGE